MMIRRITFILSLCAMVMLCCQCTTSKELRHAKKGAKSVPYTVLENYYVRNDIDGSKQHQLILDNERDFNAYFGPAAIMGGQPTDINWNKQFVVAILLPETNKPTMVTPMGVKQSPGNVIFKYQVNKGRKTSYKLIPFAAVALNRSSDPQQLQVFFIQD